METFEERKRWEESHSAIGKWLGRVGESTGKRYLNVAFQYFKWLEESGGEYGSKTPEELIDLQAEALGRDRYTQLDLLERWIKSLGDLRVGTKKTMYSAIRSFYAHNRAGLPKDLGFTLRSETPPVNGELSVEDLRKIILSSNTLYRAVFLIYYQSGIGSSEFEYFNMNSWGEVKPQLYEDKPVKISLPGRKHGGSWKRRPYYTFIGRDAKEALNKYLKEVRGKIGDGEVIFLNEKKRPLTYKPIHKYFNRHADKVNIIKRVTPECPACGGETRRLRRDVEEEDGSVHDKVFYVCNECGEEVRANSPRISGFIDLARKTRYGVNPHELRDLFRTEWETTPAKGIVADFMMGHNIDPNQYNKFFRNTEFTRQEYMKAEPYLNILSEDPRVISKFEVTTLRQELDKVKEENKDLRKEVAEIKAMKSEMKEIRETFKDIVKGKAWREILH